MFRRNLMFTITIFFLNAPVSAKEGFTTEVSVLHPLSSTWADRTFMLYSESLRIPVGTAFLIYNKDSSSFFVTAKHTLRDCLIAKPCSLRRSTPWLLKNKDQKFTSLLDYPVLKAAGFDPTSSALKANKFLNDIALLQSSFVKELGDITTIGWTHSLNSADGKKDQFEINHYVIGYPLVAFRKSLQNNPTSFSIELRISEGSRIETNVVSSNGKIESYYLVSNADSLRGNSGSPVISYDGKLLGVLVGGPDEKNYEYTPDNSYFVPVDYLKLMLGEYASKRMTLQPL